MLRKKELEWFYQNGCSFIYPDAWEKYLDPIPENERSNLIQSYYEKLTSNDMNERIKAAKAWSIWEASTSKLIQSTSALHAFEDEKVAEAFARIECHYFINKGFFENDRWILDNVYKIKEIPTYIVQGRYDVVCPMKSAWDLHREFPEAKFEIIQDAGHSMLELGIQKKLIEITDSI